MLSASTILSWMLTCLAWTLGLLSAAVAADWRLGGVVLTLHVVWMHVCVTLAHRQCDCCGQYGALLVWTASWALQIGVGHYWIEQNVPNLFHPHDEVSLLSTVTSIVLAWES